jgi:hypothetical protein
MPWEYAIYMININACCKFFLIILFFAICRDHANNNSLTSWKPYGVPLLAQIPRNETVTGFDIHELVHKMLVPMLRNQDSPQLAAQNSLSTRMHSYNTDSSKFQLQLIDDSNTVIEKSNDSIRVPQSSLATVFFINWSKADIKKRCLCMLPQPREPVVKLSHSMHVWMLS